MDWLEIFKTENSGNEAVLNEVVAQAHLENYALKLFQYADKMIKRFWKVLYIFEYN